MRHHVVGKCAHRGAVAGFCGALLVGAPFAAAAQPPQAADAVREPVETRAQLRSQSLLACPTTLDQIGRVVIPVEINGRGPFRFVIDTGANHSTVSPKLVRTVGLPISANTQIDLEGVTGSNSTPAVKIRSLRAGALVIRNTYAPVLSTPMMAGADGILGIAGLRNMTLLVNFEHNRVRIARFLEPDVRFDYSRVHTEVVSGGLMAIESYVGDVKAVAIIDTGSERTLGNMALRNMLHMRHAPGTPEPITFVYGATRQVEIGQLMTSPPIAVGPLRVLGAAMIFGNFHIFKVWGLQKRPAIILGMDVLGTVRALGFDFPQHALFVAGARQGNNPAFRARAYQTSSAIH